MTNETTTTTVRPEPLSIYKLHSPEVVRAWKASEAAYFDSLRKAELEAARKLEAERAYSNRVLTEDEAFALAVARENDQRARDLERQAAHHAEEQQRLEALAAHPDVAVVITPNVVRFLEETQHWVRRGYQVDLHGPLHLDHRLYHLTLRAPTKKPSKEAAR